ncbi:hypothetical protein [Butyrivibrio proteoclasticus]|uniref:hypothetical protein n=1 Tax=Butyrivibrio proteoclasticus TaxID=43305 RepID=UPI00047D94D8|nr:hypothetical protein [Butyrivibrio proteoclasticus]
MFESRLYREVNRGKEFVKDLSDDDLFELHRIISSMRIVQEHNSDSKKRVYAIYGDDAFVVNLDVDSLMAIGEKLARRELLTDPQYEYLKFCLSLKCRYIFPVQMVVSYFNDMLTA